MNDAFKNFDFGVYRTNGEYAYSINPALCEAKTFHVDHVQTIKNLHQSKMEIFEAMESSDDPIQLKNLAFIVEKIEFNLQEAWGFPKDRNFHEWYLVPKCSCPKMDNEENKGFDRRIINSSCLVHGNGLNKVVPNILKAQPKQLRLF